MFFSEPLFAAPTTAQILLAESRSPARSTGVPAAIIAPLGRPRANLWAIYAPASLALRSVLPYRASTGSRSVLALLDLNYEMFFLRGICAATCCRPRRRAGVCVALLYS